MVFEKGYEWYTKQFGTVLLATNFVQGFGSRSNNRILINILFIL